MLRAYVVTACNNTDAPKDVNTKTTANHVPHQRVLSLHGWTNQNANLIMHKSTTYDELARELVGEQELLDTFVEDRDVTTNAIGRGCGKPETAVVQNFLYFVPPVPNVKI